MSLQHNLQRASLGRVWEFARQARSITMARPGLRGRAPNPL
jgi:hypothetical protein